jgi:hypothetical protein
MLGRQVRTISDGYVRGVAMHDRTVALARRDPCLRSGGLVRIGITQVSIVVGCGMAPWVLFVSGTNREL